MFIVSVLLDSRICNENSVPLCSPKHVFQFKIYTHKRSKVMRQDPEEATSPILRYMLVHNVTISSFSDRALL